MFILVCNNVTVRIHSLPSVLDTHYTVYNSTFYIPHATRWFKCIRLIIIALLATVASSVELLFISLCTKTSIRHVTLKPVFR